MKRLRDWMDAKIKDKEFFISQQELKMEYVKGEINVLKVSLRLIDVYIQEDIKNENIQ